MAQQRNRPLSAAQATRFAAAMALLRAGRTAEAMTRAQSLVAEAPAAADARQLLAMCAAEEGNPALAEAEFRKALAMAPDAPVVVLNFAAWLRRAGRLQECVRLLEQGPTGLDVELQLGMACLQLGEHRRARAAFDAVLARQADHPVAWNGLGRALGGLGDGEAAAEAFANATRIAPSDATGWINLGTALRLLGRSAEALGCLRRAQSLGSAAPELHDALNGVLLDLGETVQALAGARQLVARRPDFGPGHETLAHLLWEHGCDEDPAADPFAAFRTAARAQPDHRELQLRFIRMLLSARRPAEAWAWLEGLGPTARADPGFAWLAADALDMLGRMDEASAIYARLSPVLGGSMPSFLNAYARHAFRRGLFDLARDCAGRALRIDALDQEAWSHLGTAWRLLGDEREHWLFDYERLVGYPEVELPDGLGGSDGFLRALASSLEALHVARRAPVNQSVRQGSQTAGRLFGRDDPLIRATAAALEAAALRWLAGLREVPDHPFLSRRRQGLRCVGSWSVRLVSSGRHANHIHNEGWLSSAFYVALPPSVMEPTDHSRSGWIQFGQPMEELGLALPPRRMLRPQPGRLALFPSFIWHGTLPFEDPKPRLTIAFDMQPA